MFRGTKCYSNFREKPGMYFSVQEVLLHINRLCFHRFEAIKASLSRALRHARQTQDACVNHFSSGFKTGRIRFSRTEYFYKVLQVGLWLI